MVILGIDPGTASTGYGAIRLDRRVAALLDYGVILTPKTEDMPQRLLKLRRELLRLIRDFAPDALVAERIFFNANVKTAISVGQARGVVMLVSAEKKVSFFEDTPLSIKKVLVGYGRADKKKVQQAVRKILKLKKLPRPDDAADALAVALTYCIKNQGYRLNEDA